MSHHLDYSPDPRLDITDLYCFAGRHGTVLAMNVAPLQASGFYPDGYYELRMDTSAPLDFVEDITWRVTFPTNGNGTQHVRVEQLTGAAAGDRDATGEVITPDIAPLGQVIVCANGVRLFAGERGEPFFNDARFTIATKEALSAGVSPDFSAFRPPRNDFGQCNVNSIVLEVPETITGTGTVGVWGTTAAKEHGAWHQVQHAAGPLVGFIYDFAGGPAAVEYNAGRPKDHLSGRPASPESDPASGVWGQIRDSTAAVVAARGTYGNDARGKESPLAYGAYVADTLLPDVLRFDVGSAALWAPWSKGVQNGKGLTECAPDAVYDLVLNEALSMELSCDDATGTLLDRFPYLSEPIPPGDEAA
jgi:hypothetical protein